LLILSGTMTLFSFNNSHVSSSSLEIPEFIEFYKFFLLMNLIVSYVHNYECMMNRCVNCPGTNPLLEYLMTTIQNDSIIKFKKWESTDRTILHNLELSIVMNLSNYWLPKSIN
jgi:hypothetical protein